MTERLYYTDPYCREFESTVTAADEHDGRLHVTLAETAFYPTSGGQPFDTGQLGGSRVVDVVDDEERGAIVHVIEAARPAVAPGSRVRGAIDWHRRFDHMQQHTGQHVLSAALDHLFSARTVSFHLGSASSTIDIARELSSRDIAAAEEEANRIVWEDRPVVVRFATAAEAAAMPLRKESAREGTLRLIDIEGFDLSACGGTHVARTGAVGLIAIRSWERFKGGQRLEFLCGGRALAGFRALREAVDACVGITSAAPDELGQAIERYQADLKDQKRTITGLQTELARFRAAEIAGEAESIGSSRVAFKALDTDANGLKGLAATVATRAGHAAVLVSSTQPLLIVVARHPDVPFAANALLSTLVARFGGRGGGKAELAQGGGLNGSPGEVLETARAAVAPSREGS
jgi:alanyl-tRNA synthetase